MGAVIAIRVGVAVGAMTAGVFTGVGTEVWVEVVAGAGVVSSVRHSDA